ncbi:helix-turn-helix transcriptional regulator [Haloglomus halophilum]|uniref:helix-turn-helix transcriptional regulator n=1 Tax=Haloglomus halophilum TaxID=2962672 RepID=UPI0020CA22A1|nr:helix-turn-helix domain-containing protein [Haloglomus halophilum]
MNTDRTSLKDHVTTMYARLRRALGTGRGDRQETDVGVGFPETTETDPPAGTTDAPTIADGSGAAETLTRSELAGRTGLSPEQYIRQLLAEHDGRLRQSDVGDLARLSASTTSRLLSEMEADQQITRVSIGREKVVCLPSSTPDSANQRAV